MDQFRAAAGRDLGHRWRVGLGQEHDGLVDIGNGAAPGPNRGGRIEYLGENLLEKSKGELRDIRVPGISMVMQDPLTSLNPVFTVGDQLTETLRLEYPEPKRSLRQRAAQLLANVRIPAPEDRLDNYPHQMSGGMRQRVVGAIAIARAPNLLMPTSPPLP